MYLKDVLAKIKKKNILLKNFQSSLDSKVHPENESIDPIHPPVIAKRPPLLSSVTLRPATCLMDLNFV